MEWLIMIGIGLLFGAGFGCLNLLLCVLLKEKRIGLSLLPIFILLGAFFSFWSSIPLLGASTGYIIWKRRKRKKIGEGSSS